MLLAHFHSAIDSLKHFNFEVILLFSKENDIYFRESSARNSYMDTQNISLFNKAAIRYDYGLDAASKTITWVERVFFIHIGYGILDSSIPWVLDIVDMFACFHLSDTRYSP